MNTDNKRSIMFCFIEVIDAVSMYHLACFSVLALVLGSPACSQFLFVFCLLQL